MDQDKDKAKWDDDSTRIFINACIDQIYGRERRGGSFSVDGWTNIASTFNQKTGKTYDKKQFKNRLESLRREWLTWDKLFSRETGLGRDPVTNTVQATDEWWARKIKENPAYRRYRRKPLMFETELNFIFKDAVASGEFMVAPSSTQPPVHGVHYDDVYIPVRDQQEGSGDSEEEDFGANVGGSVGVSDDMANINLSNNTAPSEPSNSGSRGKRKIGESSVRGKKQKTAASRQIADAVSLMAAASKDRNLVLKDIKDQADAVMLDVVEELITIDKIISDESLRNRCITLMMDKTCRDMFLTLRKNRQFLVSWLKDIAYDPRYSKPPPAP